MSYEDVKKARAERVSKVAEKEAKKMEKKVRKAAKTAVEAVDPVVGKEEHSRKRKAATPNLCAPGIGVSVTGSSERQLARYEQEGDMPDIEVLATSLYDGHTERYASAPQQY